MGMKQSGMMRAYAYYKRKGFSDSRSRALARSKWRNFVSFGR